MDQEKRQQNGHRLDNRACRGGEALHRQCDGPGATCRSFEEGSELRGVGLGACVAHALATLFHVQSRQMREIGVSAKWRRPREDPTRALEGARLPVSRRSFR